MSELRRQSWWVSLLVILAIMASPLARAFCRAVVEHDHHVMAHAAVPCHGEHAGGETGPVHSKTADCAVCLALASCVPGVVALAPASNPLGEIRTRVGARVAQVVPARLLLGGLGSRAPPGAV